MEKLKDCGVNNIIFMALACDTIPHYITIAAFVSGLSENVAVTSTPSV